MRRRARFFSTCKITSVSFLLSFFLFFYYIVFYFIFFLTWRCQIWLQLNIRKFATCQICSWRGVDTFSSCFSFLFFSFFFVFFNLLYVVLHVTSLSLLLSESDICRICQTVSETLPLPFFHSTMLFMFWKDFLKLPRERIRTSLRSSLRK